MVDSRLRVNPPSIFHCFVSVAAPQNGEASYVQETFPEDFEEKESILKGIPAFCFPCTINYDGVQYSTFVLTDLDSRFRFGFCRYPPYAKHCLCIVSYFPWFHTFYGVLDKVAQINSKGNNLKGVSLFLEALNEQTVPLPGSKLYFHFNDENTTQSFKVTIPDTTKLPSIPDNRNLTEYFAKVNPENMVNLFISMLFERRIIICSEKLSVLTAVVHGSVSLLYPMQWQHIYIPILPAHLIDYCCAPMPFLLGVHASMMEKVRKMPLSEVVMFDADTNEMWMMPEDLEIFPSRISSKLKRKLRHLDRALEDYVSRQFLNSLADIMGGYRDALKFLETDEGEKIVFDDEMFLNSRTGNTRVFLENILNLQSFRQFIAGRLEKLNDDQALEDIFEKAINQRSLDAASENKYSHLKDKMRKGGGAIKKGGAALKKTVDGSYSQLKVMAQDIDTKEFKKKIKDKVKDVKGVMQIGQKDALGEVKEQAKKKNWSPNLRRQRPQTGPNSPLLAISKVLTDGQRRRPPPRPPRPASELFYKPKSCDSSPVEFSSVKRERNPSHSESDIPTLLDLSVERGLQDGGADGNSITLSYGTSDTDSSTGRSEEGCENPAFDGSSASTYNNASLNLKSSSPTEEDLLFEHTPISPNTSYDLQNTRHQYTPPLTNEQNVDKNITSGARCGTTYQNPVALKKFHNNDLFYKPTMNLIDYSESDPSKQNSKTTPSITRNRHVSGKKPLVPPRPASISTPESPDRPQPPSRPTFMHLSQSRQDDTNNETRDLIFDSDSSNNSVSTPSHLADLTFEDSSPEMKQGAVFSTLPSSDLLGLEQSLFHETMRSMSDDTRSLLTLTNSTAQCDDHLNNSSTNFSKSKAFFEKRDSVPNYNVSDFSRNSHLTKVGVVESKVINSTTSCGMFASCLEEAKNIKYVPR